MKILALEFSSSQRSVAVVDTAPAPAGVSVHEVVETGPGATRALTMVENVLAEARLAREQVECLAVGIGPGSYTGIRAALALAQGWQLARGVKLLGISSAECLAAQAQAEGLTGQVTVIIDAQREEFYLAECEITGTQRTIAPLRIASLAEVRERASAGAVLIGPDVAQKLAQGRNIFPRAAALARLAIGRNDFVRGEDLEPIYLRATAFVKAKPPRCAPPR